MVESWGRGRRKAHLNVGMHSSMGRPKEYNSVIVRAPQGGVPKNHCNGLSKNAADPPAVAVGSQSQAGIGAVVLSDCSRP